MWKHALFSYFAQLLIFAIPDSEIFHWMFILQVFGWIMIYRQYWRYPFLQQRDFFKYGGAYLPFLTSTYVAYKMLQEEI